MAKVIPSVIDKHMKSKLSEEASAYGKPQLIYAAKLSSKHYLETQADIEEYLKRLRDELETGIHSNKRIEIR